MKYEWVESDTLSGLMRYVDSATGEIVGRVNGSDEIGWTAVTNSRFHLAKRFLKKGQAIIAMEKAAENFESGDTREMLDSASRLASNANA